MVLECKTIFYYKEIVLDVKLFAPGFLGRGWKLERYPLAWIAHSMSFGMCICEAL